MAIPILQTKLYLPRRELTELRAADLRFTPEAAIFLSKLTGLTLTPEAVTALEQQTEAFSNRAIAETLVISVGAAKRHVTNIHGKLEARSRTQAIARAKEVGLFT